MGVCRGDTELTVSAEFEIIERSGIGQGRSSEEFVSAMAIKEDKRRGTGGRATRATRNRD